MEDRPMNESLRHTIVDESENDGRKTDKVLLEALNLFQAEKIESADTDHRKTIILVDGRVPASFGLVSSQ